MKHRKDMKYIKYMKKSILVAGLVLLLVTAAFAGFLAGRKSAVPVIGATFYAVIDKIDGNYLTVSGLEVNDINSRGRFQFAADENTILEWRLTKIDLTDLRVGDTISVTYTGSVMETSPAMLNDVVKVQLLDDEISR